MNRREMRQRKNKVSRPKTKFWTVKGKTIWDVLQLLIIPLVLSGIALSFNYSQSRRNESIEATRIAEQRSSEAEALLRSYISSMTNLLLDENLRSSAEGSEVRTVARSLTLSTLRSLDAERKASVVKFLVESNLAQSEDQKLSIISLEGADLSGAYLRFADLNGADLTNAYLSGADLSGAYLTNAYLRGADLTNAYLSGADLTGANLTNADLSGADLSGANLTNARLSQADLTGANLTNADLNRAILGWAILSGATATNGQLASAYSLEGAIMPDGQIYDPAIHTEIARLRKEAGLMP